MSFEISLKCVQRRVEKIFVEKTKHLNGELTSADPELELIVRFAWRHLHLSTKPSDAELEDELNKVLL